MLSKCASKIFERDLFAHAQCERELPVKLGAFGAQQCRRHGRNGDAGLARRQPPKSDGPLRADFAVRRHALRRQHIHGGDGLRTRQIGRDEQIEERVHQFAQSLGLLVAIHHHDDVALGGLPQQHDVERLGGGGESGERLARVRIANQPADHLLKGGVATERLKQITDRWMCH